MQEPKLKVSFKLFVLDVVGAILVATGMMGWFGGPNLLPAPMHETWFVVASMGLGLGLMAWFMFDLIKRIRAHGVLTGKQQ